MGTEADASASAAKPKARTNCGSIRAGMCRIPKCGPAIASGDLGFLHSFTTGSAVDGPGIRVVAWTSLCMFALQVLPQPRYLDADRTACR